MTLLGFVIEAFSFLVFVALSCCDTMWAAFHDELWSGGVTGKTFHSGQLALRLDAEFQRDLGFLRDGAGALGEFDGS